MKNLSLLLITMIALGSAQAFADSATTIKQIDTILNSTGGSSLAVPSIGSVFDTDSNTVTLSNKSLSGSSNTFTNIPVSAISTGTALGVSAGGTGDITLTTNGMLFGNGTSAVGITAAGAQYSLFQAGASGVPTVGSIHLDQSAAVGASILGAANGGTGVASPTSGGLLVGAGSSPVTSVTCSNTGYILAWNGSAWACTAPPSSNTPVLNGTQASPQSITAAGGLSLSGLGYTNLIFISASTSGTTTVTATPSITACTAAGQTLLILGESATNLVKLQDQAGLSGSALALNGNWTSGLNSTLSLTCDGNGIWVEAARQQ